MALHVHPCIPSTYRTLFLGFISLLLIANGIGEFVWGWPDYEFGVDHTPASYMNVNVDLIVNMLCKCTYHTLLLNQNILTEFIDLSVDLRDVVGGRLFLSRGIRRGCVR